MWKREIKEQILAWVWDQKKNRRNKFKVKDQGKFREKTEVGLDLLVLIPVLEIH